MARSDQPLSGQAVAAFLASPENTFVTGQVVACDGGPVRLRPSERLTSSDAAGLSS